MMLPARSMKGVEPASNHIRLRQVAQERAAITRYTSNKRNTSFATWIVIDFLFPRVSNREKEKVLRNVSVQIAFWGSMRSHEDRRVAGVTPFPFVPFRPQWRADMRCPCSSGYASHLLNRRLAGSSVSVSSFRMYFRNERQHLSMYS